MSKQVIKLRIFLLLGLNLAFFQCNFCGTLALPNGKNDNICQPRFQDYRVAPHVDRVETGTNYSEKATGIG